MFRFPAYLSPGRNQNGYIEAIFAVALIAFPMTATLRLEDPFVLKMKQRIDALGALDKDISSFSAIPSARSALGHKLLSPESKASIPPASGNYSYSGPIDKQVCIHAAK
jgi:hypothetical protein